MSVQQSIWLLYDQDITGECCLGDYIDSLGRTVLHIAVAHGRTTIVETRLDRRPNTEITVTGRDKLVNIIIPSYLDGFKCLSPVLIEINHRKFFLITTENYNQSRNTLGIGPSLDNARAE